MLGCEIWTIKNVECRRIDAFELWCWRRFLRMLWTARRSNQSILKEVNPVFTRRTDPVKILLQEPPWLYPKAFRCYTSNIITAAAVAASLQSCLTLCVPIDSSLPGSYVPAILQARTLEWVAISFSNAGKWKVKVKSLSRVQLFTTPWTAAHQALLSMGVSRQISSLESWSRICEADTVTLN